MPEIPPEDQPAHERIQRIFNNPLINKTKKQLKELGLTKSDKSSSLIHKSPTSYQKKKKQPVITAYQKQSQPQFEKSTVQVLETSEWPDPAAEESQVGLLQLPCNINMTGKQSHCYNVQEMTKDKAAMMAASGAAHSNYFTVQHTH